MERTPHLDPYARGVFFGLTPRHQRSHVVRAIMEGVVHSLEDALVLVRSLGIPINAIRVSGGGAKSKVWRTIQADVFNQIVYSIAENEGPAFGAAILAGVGIGLYPSVEEACSRLVPVLESTQPSPQNRDLYRRYYTMYQSLYPLLRESFHFLYQIVQESNAPAGDAAIGP